MIRFLNPFYWRQRRVAAQRKSLSSQEFLDNYSGDLLHRFIAERVWKELQLWIKAPQLNVNWGDDLRFVYGFEDDDLEDYIKLWLDDANREFKGGQLGFWANVENVVSVDDLVRGFAADQSG